MYETISKETLRKELMVLRKRLADMDQVREEAVRIIVNLQALSDRIEEQTRHRRAYQREYMRKRRARETPEERETRLARHRDYIRKHKERSARPEDPEAREARLARMREYARERRARETPEERERRLAYHREYNRKH